MLSRRFRFVSLSVLGIIASIRPDPSFAQKLPAGTAKTVIASAPLGFEPNYGQTSPPIKYVAATENLRLELRPGGFDLSTGRLDQRQIVMRVDFADAISTASFTASERLPGETNYFLGRDPSTWHTHIPNSRQVTYSSVYPGIDAVFYRNGKQLEHDFRVAPGADYRKIRMRVYGFHKLLSQADGSVRLSVSSGDVVFRAPDVYQPSGDIWLAGTTKDPFFPMAIPLNSVFGSANLRLPGFLSELDPTGSNLIFSTYIGDLSQGAQSLSVAVDPHGDVHLTGVTGSELYTSPGAYVGSVAAPPPNVDFLYGFATVIDPSVPSPAICFPFPFNEGVTFFPTVIGTSTEGSVTIQSCGSGSLTINSIQSSDPNFGVPLGSNGCLKTLQVGTSCTLSVVLAPLAQGALSSALIFTSNASMPTALPLTGAGQLLTSAPYFAFGAVPASPSVTIQAPGDTSSPVTLAIIAENGFTGQVNFSPASCSISPAGSLSTCTFTAGSITGSGTTQVTINTTAPESARLPPTPLPKDWPAQIPDIAVIFACCSLAGAAAAKRSGSRIAVVLLLSALLGFCQACGGGASNSGAGNGNSASGTPANRVYTVTVTATSGQVSQSTNFAFIVQ